jgi:MATE family multidrug resistance protein
MVDVAVTGHLGTVYLAAIAVGGTMFNILYWLFAFLRMGSSGMTAQAYGANDHVGASLVLYRALSVALILGFIIVLFRAPLSRLLFMLIAPDATTADNAQRYFDICVWGAPAVLSTYALSGWFLGMQDSRAPMWMSIIINVVNIAVSLILVYVCRLSIDGVATGTLTAQWVGLAAGIALCYRYRPGRRPLHDVFAWTAVRRFFSVNVDIFLRTVCLVAVTLCFTRIGAGQGSTILAVNTLLMQLFMLFSFFMDGFAFAGEAICGRDMGRGDMRGLRSSIAALFRWSIGLTLVFTVIYAIGGRQFVFALSGDVAVATTAGEYLWWAIAIPAAGVTAFTWDGVMIGMTQTRRMLLSMVIAAIAFFALLALLFPTYHNHALWAAFVAYLAMRGLVQTILARRIMAP